MLSHWLGPCIYSTFCAGNVRADARRETGQIRFRSIGIAVPVFESMELFDLNLGRLHCSGQ